MEADSGEFFVYDDMIWIITYRLLRATRLVPQTGVGSSARGSPRRRTPRDGRGASSTTPWCKITVVDGIICRLLLRGNRPRQQKVPQAGPYDPLEGGGRPVRGGPGLGLRGGDGARGRSRYVTGWVTTTGKETSCY